MTPEAVALYQRDAARRPPADLGRWARSSAGVSRTEATIRRDMPIRSNIFGATSRAAAAAGAAQTPAWHCRAQGAGPASALTRRRMPDTIRSRYKDMVKRLHPDANGGDRSLEDKLREIIRAYNYLKSVKLA